MRFQETPLLLALAGSNRYGCSGESSDQDFMVLTSTEDRYFCEYDDVLLADYFFVSVDTLRSAWGHPLLLGNLTGECTGDERLCAFLAAHKRELSYAAPAATASLGLDYIAGGERYGFASPIKAGLRTAMILSHMAEGAEDPFLLSGEEKAVLSRARTGGVPLEERVELYRRTISPENIGRLMKLPDHPTVKSQLFRLIEEAISRT